MKIVSKQIRASAKGEACSLRIPGVCNFDPTTTVLAHLPVGMGGMGTKSPDLFACYACSSCHDAIDRRGGERPDGWQVMRALAETQIKLIEKGLIVVKGVIG